MRDQSVFNVVFLLVAACGAAPLKAQPSAPAPHPLTLADCIRLAEEAQSSASIARQELDIAGYAIRQARGAFLPQVQLGSGFTYNSSGKFVALNGVREYSSLFAASLQIDTAGKLRAGLARARADKDIAGANLAIAQRDLRRLVTAAFFRLSLTRHLVDVAHSSFNEAHSFEERTKLLFEHGEAAQADTFKASTETAFLTLAVNAVELDAKLANQELASFWTMAVEEPLDIVDSLAQIIPSPEPEAAPPSSSFLRRPEFNLYDAQKRGFLADYRRTRADLFPQATFVYQYGFDANVPSLSQRGSAALVNLTVPIFDWYRAISSARQFQLRARIVESNVQTSQRTFSREYQTALARVKMIYQQIAITESQVKNSEDNLRLSRIRYEGGEGPALEVVSAQTQAAQARSNYYNAIANYLNARADLEVAAPR
jgi:outer membrane protein